MLYIDDGIFVYRLSSIHVYETVITRVSDSLTYTVTVLSVITVIMSDD